MSSPNLTKDRFWSIDLTCWRSIKPLRLRFLKAYEFLKTPTATAAILKILHPFRCSGLGVVAFRLNENFIQQLSAMFTCRDGRDGELSNQALAE